MTLVQYNQGLLMDARGQIASAAQRTIDNHSQSVNIATRNQDNLEGSTGMNFQSVISKLNHDYTQAQELIDRAGAALEAATQGMGDGDGRAAAQYGGGA
ncbi:hypothetical protein [Mycolicibacterium arenosum]|uniref:ESAT-6-like protein EsxB n=1 Tax=Mycolicibacterium arenosum TaxID=2952157 RepID=A0ABT1MGM2_9MYCO|nr:hypothetical protein [Mycolicibacterium sp. CAU 1645]MCP9276912.1 hypothetical protein [Mycolicibacterium sp. CAU 1645]